MGEEEIVPNDVDSEENSEDEISDEDEEEISDLDDESDDNLDQVVEQPDDDEIAKTKPARIKVTDTIFEAAFHPSKDILAVGEITGTVSIFSFSNGENKKLIDFKHQKEACRCLSFSSDGQRLYSGCQDNSIYCSDMNTGSILHTIPNAHDQSISAMHLVSDNFLTSGCEAGVVKVWDLRTFSKAADFAGRKDYISALTSDKQKKHLLSTSGDGVLSVFNLRKNAIVQESDQLDDELLCLDIIKNGKKVICGSATGVLNIYSWGEWGDISDRYPTRSDEIESVCSINDDIICYGTGDGYVKAMYVQPYKEIKTVGRHGIMGVGSMKLSPDKSMLVSCGGDETVRFWKVADLQEESLDEDERRGVKRKRTDGDSKAADFFADL